MSVVGVEDTLAEKILEGGANPGAFREVVEVVLEHVFDVGGVSSDDSVDPTGAVDNEGVGGGGGEAVGHPVVEAVAVLEELGEVAEDWVRLDVVVIIWVLFLEEEEEEVNGEGEEGD